MTEFSTPVFSKSFDTQPVDSRQVNDFDPETHQLAMTIAAAADERKGGSILLLEIGKVSVLADYFVIITGFSKVQVRAIARSVQENVEEELHRRPLRIEGMTEGGWVLVDYGDVIVHILMPQEREFYNLEAFWGHANQIPYVASAVTR